MFTKDFFVAGTTGEVCPLVRILDHVVEFLGAIGVVNITPVLGTNTVIALVVRSDGRTPAGSVGIFELGQETDSFKSVFGFEPTQIDECGIHIEQFGRPFAFGILGDSRPGKNKRNAGAIVPEGVFARDFLFAEMPAVIRPEHDHGIVLMSAFLKCIEDPSNLAVHKTDRREIGARNRAPLLLLFQPGKSNFGEVPMEIPGEERRVVAVVVENWGEHGIVVRIEVKPLLGGVEGDVRQKESAGQEEGLVFRHVVELVNRPGRAFPVALFFVFMRKRSPIHQSMVSKRSGDDFLCWVGTATGPRSPFMERIGTVFLSTRIAAVPDLAGGIGSVAMFGKPLGNRDRIAVFGERSHVRSQTVDSG